MVAALITLLMPGAGPPPTRIASLLVTATMVAQPYGGDHVGAASCQRSARSCGRMAGMLLLLALTAPAISTRRRLQRQPTCLAIRNFMRVTPEFCTGGQPRLEHFAS